MKFKVFGLILLILALVPRFEVQAQGGVLNYGDTTVGSLSATTPLAFYTFSGTEGDRVTIMAIGITPGLDPAVSLNSPTQQQLANNDNDPTSPGTTDARITMTLAQTGVHTVLVSSVGAATGDFLIRLFGQPAAPATDVSETGASTTISGATQVFSFNADPDGPLAVTVSTTTPDFAFLVSAFDPNGQTVAVSSGSDAVNVSLNVPPGTGVYTVEVTPVDPNAQGEVQVSVGAVGQPPPQEPPPPAATEEVEAPDDVCTVSTPTGPPVNVRSGPGTNFDVVANITPNESLVVTGEYNGWYRVDVPDVGEGWVFADVVATSGSCDAIPALSEEDVQTAPAGVPTDTPQPGQATPTFTATPAPEQGQATATYTPSYTPTSAPQQEQATATYTPSYTPTSPPEAQVAPEDARFNNPLNIPLDSTASVTDFVSYPGGDTEDRVRWDITGMNPNSALSGGRAHLIIAVSCFGTNTNQIQFFTGGQTYSCGQTIVDREVTYDSRTGQVTITAVGGEGTYVQWVLTGTATRSN